MDNYNTSRISQATGNETDAEDNSISVYYSFNASDVDRTLEAEFFEENTTLEFHESTTQTVLKKPITPHPNSKKSILNKFEMFSSTPAKGNFNKMKTSIKSDELGELGVAKLQSFQNDSENLIFTERITNTTNSDRLSCLEVIEILSDDSTDNIEITEIAKEDSIKANQIKIIVETVEEIEEIVSTKNFSAKKKLNLEYENICNSEDKENLSSNKLINLPEHSRSKENKIKNAKSVLFTEENPTVIDTNSKQKYESHIPKAGTSTLSGRKSILSNNRKSFLPRCEPDLRTNRPSRISQGRRVSVMNRIKEKTTGNKNEMTANSIPKILENLIKNTGSLKIKENTENQSKKLIATDHVAVSNIRKPIIKSVLKVESNSIRINKKPTNVLKTTLNSPAKIFNQRKTLDYNSVQLRRTINPVRKSMMPIKSVDKTLSKKIPVNVAALTGVKPKMEIKRFESTTLKNEQKKLQGFVCQLCSKSFRLKSEYNIHEKTHQKITNIKTNSKCKYCDKMFAISKALDNHLIEHCPKIPSSERRKLLAVTTEEISLKINNTNESSASMKSINSNDSATPLQTDKIIPSNDMPPPSSKNIRKQIPHSGVYRTPNKVIICYICKKTFDNILAFTEHTKLHKNNSPNRTE